MGSSGRSNRSIVGHRGSLVGGRGGAGLAGDRPFGGGAADIWSRLRGSRLGRRENIRAAAADLRRHPRRRTGQRRSHVGSGGSAGARKSDPAVVRHPAGQPRRDRSGQQELGARRRSQSKFSRPVVRDHARARLFSGSRSAVGAREPGGGGGRRTGDPGGGGGPRPAGLRQLRRSGRALGGGRRGGLRVARPGRHRLPDSRLFRIVARDRSRLACADFGASAGSAGARSPGRPRRARRRYFSGARGALRRRTSRQMR